MTDLSATIEAQLAQLNKESLETAAKKLSEELQRPDQLAKVNLNNLKAEFTDHSSNLHSYFGV